MDKYNCPNCGAPIASTSCPYCGTTIYDFATLDTNKPTYIRIRYSNNVFICKAVLRSAAFSMESDSFPVFDAEFMVLPDDNGTLMIKQEVDT